MDKNPVDEIVVDRVLVSAFPEDHVMYSYMKVSVERRGIDSYAVCDGRKVFSKNNEWLYESMPSTRTEDFISQTRFSFEEAVRRAKKVAESMTMMGLTVNDYYRLDEVDSDEEKFELRKQLLEKNRAEKELTA